MDLGFIGAGLMGEGMAANLLKANHMVATAVHRDAAPIARLEAAGAEVRPTAAAVAEGAEVVFLCLPNADVVQAMVAAIRGRLAAGALIVDTTTSLPKVSAGLAASLAEDGVGFVDAPVTGGPEQAAAGELISLVGGEANDVDRAEVLLAATSRRVVRFGGPGAGHAAKLINNYITQGQAAMTIEAMRRCDALGIDRETMFSVLSEGAARSGILMRIVPSVLAGTYDGQKFSIANAAKDVSYVAQVCVELGEDSPVVAGLQAFFEAEAAAWPPDTFVSRVLGPKPKD